MKFVKSVMAMVFLKVIGLPIKILIQLTCVIIVAGQVILGNIMNEKEILHACFKHEKEVLIECMKKPGYAAMRLQSHYGYSMLQLQQIRNGEPVHKSTK